MGRHCKRKIKFKIACKQGTIKDRITGKTCNVNASRNDAVINGEKISIYQFLEMCEIPKDVADGQINFTLANESFCISMQRLTSRNVTGKCTFLQDIAARYPH